MDVILAASQRESYVFLIENDCKYFRDVLNL